MSMSIYEGARARISEWLADPEKFADDETDEPSPDACRAALEFLRDGNAGAMGLPLVLTTVGSGGTVGLVPMARKARANWGVR